MSKKSILQCLCNCLEIISGKQKGPQILIFQNEESVIVKDLENNINAVIQLINDNHELKKLFDQYPTCLFTDNETSPVWRFVEWCSVLLNLLNSALFVNSENKAKSSKNADPTGLLSISQQKIVKNCLQFIVALGILPNLLPGIGIPLEQRLEHANVVRNLCQLSNLQHRHRQLVLSLSALLYCLQEETLQSIILTYYSSDLLGALFQLSYAPIKKVDKNINDAFQLMSTRSSVLPLEKRDIAKLILKLRDQSTCSQEELINEMYADRSYFSSWLDKLLNQICPSTLMWELLLFQGINLKDTKGSNLKALKVPVWLKKLCNKLLTNMMLQPYGITRFVQSVLDRASDQDLQGGAIDKNKLEAVALLITCNPVKHMPFEIYVDKLSNQVITLLSIRGSTMDVMLNYIASCIVLHFLKFKSDLAEKYFLQPLFGPLSICVQLLSENSAAKEKFIVCGSKSGFLLSEKDLTTCIETSHQIFVLGPAASNQKVDKLLPFCQVFFCMFTFMQSGKSFLRSKVKELLVTLLSECDSETAVAILHRATFYEYEFFLPYINYGDDGGIVISENIGSYACNVESENDELGNKCCDAIFEVLADLSCKNVKIPYFITLLKEFTEQLNPKEATESDVFSKLKKKLILLTLIQNLSDVLSEDLTSDISQAVDLVNIILGSLNDEDGVYGNETLQVALVILSSLLSYNDQLSATHWSALENCLPGLNAIQKNSRDSYLKNIARTIQVQIATHGVIRENPDNASVSEDNITEDKCTSKKENLNSPKSQSFCRLKKMHEVGKVKSGTKSKFEDAMHDLKDPILPVRSHALVCLGKLLSVKDTETMAHKEEILRIFRENMEHDDSYIYLPSIQGLSMLAECDVEFVLPIVLCEFQNCTVHNLDVTLKLGEVLLKITRILGELIVKYKNQLLHAYLVGAKCNEPSVRSSSLSNLGEVCKLMKFSLEGHLLQEILVCIKSLLKTDPDLQVRRSAAMVIVLLLQGLGVDAFQILESELKDIYSLMKTIYKIERDDVLRLHSQMALEEINSIMRSMFTPSQKLTKDIRILH